MNYIYVPVPGFPVDGLTSKVLFDRIGEITILIGIIMDKQFLYRYCPIPRIPTVGNATRVLALFDFRSMILGSDACRYVYITSGIISHTEMLASYFRKRGQTIRPSCTQAVVAIRGEYFMLLWSNY